MSLAEAPADLSLQKGSSSDELVKKLDRTSSAATVIPDCCTVAEGGSFTMLQAISLNTLNMFGTGPFITIPFLIASFSPAGPQALIGYAVAAVVATLDSFIWAELGSMMPRSGGSFVYLKETWGRDKWGQYWAFMFVWQFFLTAPMEIASGFVAMAQYLAYITEGSGYWHTSLIAFGFALVGIVLLYQDIANVGAITVALWAGTVAAIVFTLIAGFANFDVDNFNTPPGAYETKTMIVGVGAAMRFGIYDFAGYNDICQIGDEVKDPRRTIPISCVATCVFVGIVYFLVYLAVLGYLPWESFAYLAEEEDDRAFYVMSLFTEKLWNRPFAIFFTLVVVYTIFGSCYALLLGYAAVPFAAARDGSFFEIFAHQNETRKGLADYSLLGIGAITLVFCFVDLGTIINGMVTTRVICQYVAQAVGLMIYRKTHPEAIRVFKVPLYPWTVIVQIILFMFVFFTTDNYIVSGDDPLLEIAILVLIAGSAAYIPFAKGKKVWPYDEQDESFDGIGSNLDPVSEEEEAGML